MNEPSEIKTGQDALDFVRTQLLATSEALAEGIMTGKVQALALVTVEADGKIVAGFSCCRPSDAVGLLEIGKELLKRKILA